MSKLRLEVGRTGNATNVYIDGEQVWNVHRVTFTVAAGELPSAIIEWEGDIEVLGEIEIQDKPDDPEALPQ